MKGLLSEYGYLCIERTGRLRNAKCNHKIHSVKDRKNTPSWHEYDYESCRSDCAHFTEPRQILNTETGQIGTVTIIEICDGKVLTFTEFRDTRNPDKI
jgi:hypothetical protein